MRNDAHPRRVEAAGDRRHHGRDAKDEDAVVGDVVSVERSPHVVVAHGHENRPDAGMGQIPRDGEKKYSHCQDDPEEVHVVIGLVVGNAVEAAGVGLVFDDEFLKDQRFRERDHRAIDPVDVALEGNDPEDERQQDGEEQRADDRHFEMHQRRHDRGHFLQAVPLHVVGNRPAVSGRVFGGVAQLERERDEVGAHPEIDRLAQAQDPCEAPDEADAEGEDREADEHAEQVHHVLGAVERIGGEEGDHDDGAGDRP